MIEIRSMMGEALVRGEADTLHGANLRGANLCGADLGDAHLHGANLHGANLHDADLRGAHLHGANLHDADLRGAHLRGADLRGAHLRGANLCGANLCGANLRGADLRGANLCGADLGDAHLRGANLCGADLGDAHLPAFQIADGELDVWKTINDHIIGLRIPREARRTGSLVGRKCRAEWAVVVSITTLDGSPVSRVCGGYDPSLVYEVGSVVRPDRYDDDPRIECTHGIHFFLTREEAEDYQ